MTNYSSFDVQLRNRRYESNNNRQISKKLYKLGVKLARDISDGSLIKHDKQSNSKYVNNIRRELKQCREQMSMVILFSIFYF
jgi:hypothetical protein